MLTISRTTRVFLATQSTDIRKGFDGLFALVENVIREDPHPGHLFVFRNKRRDRLKVLWWDRDGLAIFYKRLRVEVMSSRRIDRRKEPPPATTRAARFARTNWRCCCWKESTWKA